MLLLLDRDGVLNRNLPEGVLDFSAQRRLEVDDHLVSGRSIAADDIAAYFHTGGTTGAPKLARHCHGAQVFTAWVCVQLQGTLAADVVINGYPLPDDTTVPDFIAGAAAGVPKIIDFMNDWALAAPQIAKAFSPA